MSWSAIQRNSMGVFILALSYFCGVSFAQTGTTSLRGAVTDKSGAAIVGANVKIDNAKIGLERSTVTGGSGEYEFLALPPGTYALTVEKQNFQKFEVAGLELLVNLPATQNVTLQVGSTSETVEVSAQAETLNTTDASLGISFEEDRVKQLPIESRNVAELLSLQAGVAYTGNRMTLSQQEVDTRSGAVNGAHSDQSNITLDGVDVNTDTKGYAFQSVLPITADSVQEFRVTTTNYNADEGRSSGAQVVLVTKSGTNDFHGAVYEYNRNAATSANDYFLKQAQLQSGAPNKAEALVRNNFGGALGGPIKKDRFFFFMNYEGERQADQQSTVRIVPSAALRDGVITYQCADATQCPGMTVAGLTGSHTIAAGYYALSPTQLKAMDPQGIGVSRNVMVPYFDSYPLPNDNSVGDGVNYQGYRFGAPNLTTDNWYIARADYKITRNGNHSLFWRGALRNDANLQSPYLTTKSSFYPGGVPEQSLVDYSKGMSVGYSAVLKSNLVNNFRYGYTRQSFGEVGNQNQPFVEFRGLNDGTGTASCCAAQEYQSTLTYQVPVHNFVDDISWIKGRHTLSFGANINILRNPQSSNINSFNQASANSSYYIPSNLANSATAGFFDPACSETAVPLTGGCFNASKPSTGEPHYPAVSSNFGTNYDYPLAALVGMVNSVTANYNFTKSGPPLPEGQPVTRRFAADTYEFYAQDAWKVKPNLTVTYGLRYSLFSPPWETNGLQVTPDVNLTNWFNQRGENALNGIGSNASPLLSFNLGGPANGKPGFYNWDYKDIAPRLAFAYSPGMKDGLLGALFGGPGKTSIRAGAGIVYDRVGPALLATFDQSGSFGLSSGLQSAAGVVNPTTAPRITGLNTIPTQGTDGTQLLAPPPVNTFPQTFPASGTGSFAVYWGMDQGLKTPYSYTLDFSIGRDLGRGFTLDVSYVGRLSHRLLSQEDVATPEDIVDPKTGVDYFSAVTALAKLYRQTNAPAATAVTPQMVGPTAQYWADIIQPLQPGDMYNLLCGGGGTPSALQAMYSFFSCFSKNESTGVQLLDQGVLTGTLKDAKQNPLNTYYGPGGPFAFMSPQFAALYAWRSISTASYHAMQVSFRHRLTHGLQFDFNYTYSKSIDISSDANRITAEGGLGGQIINPWSPKALRGVSDFDTPHQFNANWVYELPFGSGRAFASNAHGVVEALIGGWQLTGLARWTGGFPVGVGNGAQWPTNWQLSGYATKIGPAPTQGAVKNPDGTVNIFGNDPNADPNGPAAQAFSSFQADYPVQVGGRNNLRGDGFAGLDMGLDKRWKMPWKESHSLQFRWEVFNVLNLTRFDVATISLSLTGASTFGNYSSLLTSPRTMQFALRYEF